MTEAEVRAIAREEVASLCGLVLRRLRDNGPATEHGIDGVVYELRRIFGEALADFGGTKDEPGEKEE